MSRLQGWEAVAEAHVQSHNAVEMLPVVMGRLNVLGDSAEGFGRRRLSLKCVSLAYTGESEEAETVEALQLTSWTTLTVNLRDSSSSRRRNLVC